MSRATHLALFFGLAGALAFGCSGAEDSHSTIADSAATGGSGSGGTEGDGDLDVPGAGGDSADEHDGTSDDKCELPVIPMDHSCQEGLEMVEQATTVCLTRAELASACSPVQLRNVSGGAGGAGGAGQLQDLTGCPDYDELNFGFLGRACGGTHYYPVCSTPVQTEGASCCYRVSKATNAC